MCLRQSRVERSRRFRAQAQLGDLNWLELVADEDRQMSSTLWQEARIHRQLYRARFFFRARDSARRSAVDAVGAGHVAPDGAEVWLFTAIPSRPRVLHFHLSRRIFKSPLTLFRFRHGTPVRLGLCRSSTGPRRITWAFHQITRFGLQQISKHHGTPIWSSCILRTGPPRAGIGQNKFETGRPRNDQFRILGADGRIPLVSYASGASQGFGWQSPILGWREH